LSGREKGNWGKLIGFHANLDLFVQVMLLSIHNFQVNYRTETRKKRPSVQKAAFILAFS